MKRVEIKVYRFNELEEDIQDKVINTFIEDLIYLTDFENLDKHTNLYKAFKKSEDLQTPWFLGSYIFEYCNKDIIKILNSEYFYKNGEVYYE